jgi:uncharacterized protein
MTAVLDTNVLVSGLMFSANPPGRILDLVRAGKLQLVVDDRILAEYDEVLARPSFARYFTVEDCDRILGLIRYEAMPVICSERFADLPDPDDACFAECALAAEVPLVTGNLRHFPPAIQQRISILSPSQFLDVFHQA